MKPQHCNNYVPNRSTSVPHLIGPCMPSTVLGASRELGDHIILVKLVQRTTSHHNKARFNQANTRTMLHSAVAESTSLLFTSTFASAASTRHSLSPRATFTGLAMEKKNPNGMYEFRNNSSTHARSEPSFCQNSLLQELDSRVT